MLVLTFFGFRPEILFLSKFGPKNHDPEFNGSVHVFCFRLEILLLDKFGSKNKNCQFRKV